MQPSHKIFAYMEKLKRLILQVCSNTEGSFTCDEAEEEAKVKANNFSPI